MSDIYLAGVSMTPFGKHLDRSMKQLGRMALDEVCKDAGCRIGDIEAAFFGNCVQGYMEGQDMIRGEIVLRAAGVESIPVFNVENACATASTALNMAVAYVRSGAVDIALAIGVEKMFAEDKARMFGAFDGAWDVHEVGKTRETLAGLGAGLPVPEGTTSDKPYSVFMDVYAGMVRGHMKTFGSTQEQFAAVSAKNHGHSVENPLAQYRRPFTVEEVLAAPPITYPLTVPMCSPVSDGAAAALICSEAGLRKLAGDRNRAVRIAASAIRTGSSRAGDDFARHVTRKAGEAAYEQAGLGPEDVDVVEVHDATAPAEIIEVEALGFFAPGEGGPAALRGDTRIGGRLPVNPSGGLECKGHPIGATGLGQIYELVCQLRGEAGARQVEGARVGLAQNGGGVIGVEEAVVAVTILHR